jgi:hypothetical protein
MDVTPALFSVAVTLGSLMPAATSPAARAEQSVAPSVAAAAVALPAESQDIASLRRATMTPPVARRPAALLPMYASLGILQGLDIYMTTSAVQRGALEANPIMKPVAGSQAASLVVKAAATAGAIYFTERAWKQNRKGAVILMAAINVATAAVVAHNTQVARRH